MFQRIHIADDVAAWLCGGLIRWVKCDQMVGEVEKMLDVLVSMDPEHIVLNDSWVSPKFGDNLELFDIQYSINGSNNRALMWYCVCVCV